MDDYREMIEEARASLRTLLLRTEPGSGLILHNALNHLKAMAEKEDSASTAAPATQLEQWREREIESRANQATWRNLSRLDRARLIVELLGDDRSQSGE